MKTELKTFETRLFPGIRALVEEGGEPWFIAKDVADALGYIRTRDAVKEHCDDGRPLSSFDFQVGSGESSPSKTYAERRLAKLGKRPKIFGLDPKAILIPESDVYALIMSSKLPSAKAFKRWITKEVLPAIRKDGMYVWGEEKVKTGEMTEDEMIQRAHEHLQAKIERATRERAKAKLCN